MADNYYYGFDDYIEDYEEALKLYKQAIKLGCLPAYENIGKMYQRGEGVSKNTTKALEWYKEGVKKGNYYCYVGMGGIFAYSGQDDNFHKCYKLFFKNRKNEANEIVEQFSGGFDMQCLSYVKQCFFADITPSVEVAKEMTQSKEYVISTLKVDIKGKEYPSLLVKFQSALKWVEENL